MKRWNECLVNFKTDCRLKKEMSRIIRDYLNNSDVQFVLVVVMRWEIFDMQIFIFIKFFSFSSRQFPVFTNLWLVAHLGFNFTFNAKQNLLFFMAIRETSFIRNEKPSFSISFGQKLYYILIFLIQCQKSI